MYEIAVQNMCTEEASFSRTPLKIIIIEQDKYSVRFSCLPSVAVLLITFEENEYVNFEHISPNRKWFSSRRMKADNKPLSPCVFLRKG